MKYQILNGLSPEYIESLKERFWAKVDIGKPDECWEWQAVLQNGGYGKFGVGPIHQLAHRVSFELNNGPIPRGKYVCHKCDNRRCVNPKHLYAATQKENIRDALRRGRIEIGENHHASKLNGKQVLNMIRDRKERGYSYVKISKKYGISENYASEICRGLRWTHLHSG